MARRRRRRSGGGKEAARGGGEASQTTRIHTLTRNLISGTFLSSKKGMMETERGKKRFIEGSHEEKNREAKERKEKNDQTKN